MIRDFSLVFKLLLISDRRNLHRDSRRDTEQNVPCSAPGNVSSNCASYLTSDHLRCYGLHWHFVDLLQIILDVKFSHPITESSLLSISNVGPTALKLNFRKYPAIHTNHSL